MAFKIRKIDVATGIFWVEIPEANTFILCGSPFDTVKHLMRHGLINDVESQGLKFETGPNCILLADISIQRGDFSNLAEFPILQMFYRQGMILPNHPGNNGQKPILIGSSEQIHSQLEYIYRGNYGLNSEKELVNAGVSQEFSLEMMAMKKAFSFGSIKRPEELIDSCIVKNDLKEIKNNVFIKRNYLNNFSIIYGDESVSIDLNLSPNSKYESPYLLSFHNINRSYFSVIHSGEADGWDTNRPCMSSIINFQGKIYLIDVGPNLSSVLNGLGINVNEIDGIFHTHSHDDHFAGLTTLMRSDHRIKYFATPLVRASVAKKFGALLNVSEKMFNSYFKVHDMEFNKWSNIDGLEVRPVFSPHPVETSIFFFRTLSDQGYRTYAHLADIASFEVLDNMLKSKDDPRVSEKLIKQTKLEYLSPVDIKKIDVGGGIIHGQAIDFSSDKSKKLIFCHINREFTQQEKGIGEGAPYGTVDELIVTNQDFVRAKVLQYTIKHFVNIPEEELRVLLNCPIITFNPESTLLRAGERPEKIYLVLTGNVEFIDEENNMEGDLTAGSFLGELALLEKRELILTYRAKSFVKALSISTRLYMEIIVRHGTLNKFIELIKRRYIFQRTQLFGESISSPVQEKLASSMTLKTFNKGDRLGNKSVKSLMFISKGSFKRIYNEKFTGNLVTGDAIGLALFLSGKKGSADFIANESSEVYEIPLSEIAKIPTVRWKLFEEYRRRDCIDKYSNFSKDIN